MQSEAALNRQIEDLNEEIGQRKAALEQKVGECNNLREELRQSKKCEKVLEEKIRLLDDEVEVLSAQIEDAGEDNNKDLILVRTECENLRKKLAATKQDLTRVENLNASWKADMQNLKVDLESEIDIQNQLKIQLLEANRRMETAQKEKQQFQEQLQKVNTQAHAIKTKAIDIEAERDELLAELADLENNNPGNRTVDLERTELRKAKTKLELDIHRIRDERGLYAEKAQRLEADLDDAFTNATKEQTKLEKKIWDLENRLKTETDSHAREIKVAQRNIERLEERIDGMAQVDGHDSSLELELATAREQLAEVRRREGEVVQKEAAHKKTIRELRQKIDKLQADLYDAQNEAAARSPNSTRTTPGRAPGHAGSWAGCG